MFRVKFQEHMDGVWFPWDNVLAHSVEYIRTCGIHGESCGTLLLREESGGITTHFPFVRRVEIETL